jgi:hypothetical protein
MQLKAVQADPSPLLLAESSHRVALSGSCLVLPLRPKPSCIELNPDISYLLRPFRSSTASSSPSLASSFPPSTSLPPFRPCPPDNSSSLKPNRLPPARSSSRRPSSGTARRCSRASRLAGRRYALILPSALAAERRGRLRMLTGSTRFFFRFDLPH